MEGLGVLSLCDEGCCSSPSIKEASYQLCVTEGDIGSLNNKHDKRNVDMEMKINGDLQRS